MSKIPKRITYEEIQDKIKTAIRTMNIYPEKIKW